MSFVALLSTLIILIILRETNAVERIFPLQMILNSLHRQPPIAENLKNKNSRNVQELWLEQPVDHFGHLRGETWQMRYLRNDQHYKPGGSIFIFVGGEWEIDASLLQTGLMFDMAQEHNGMMYYTEHRYYGRSWPTNNTTVDNLKYLHSRQALADFAQFIAHQKSENSDLHAAPVILIGGSYSGSLAAWLTKLYPQLITATWASSAPMQAKLDFYEYLEHVGVVIKEVGGTKCYLRIRNGIRSLQQTLASAYAHVILEQFKMCDNFDRSNSLDLAAFFNAIGNYFAALVQSYSDIIKPTCQYLLSLHPGDDFAAFADYLSVVFWPTSHYSNESCIDLSYNGTKQLFTDVHDLYTGSRQWFYQTCNEFGWFTTSTPQNSTNVQKGLFGHYVDVSFFQKLCADVFDTSHTLSTMSTNIQLTNTFYETQQKSDNVIMTHGQLDPWSTVGHRHGANVLLIPGYSHVADLGSININDTVAMNVAKLKVSSFVRQRIWKAKNKPQ